MILTTGIVNSTIRIFGDAYLRNELYKLFCCKKASMKDDFSDSEETKS